MKLNVLSTILAFTVTSSLIPAALAQADKDSPGLRPGEPQPDKPEVPTSESDFVSKAAQRGAAEVKVANLAVTKAADAKIKEFAEMMVRDHTSANQELKTIAGKLNIRLEETPNAKAEEKFRELSLKTGKEFDKAYLEIMGHCHEKNIAFYEAGKKIAKASEVTAYIDKTLPVLKTHAEKIDSLNPGRDKDAQPKGTNPRPGPVTDPASPDKK